MRAQDDTDDEIKPYGLTVRSGSDLAFAIELNGIPVARHDAGSPAMRSIPMQTDVVPGKNVLEVVIGTADIAISEPLDAASAPRPEASDFTMALERETYVPTDVPGERRQVLELVKQIEYEPEVVNGLVTLPQKLIMEFTAPENQHRPVWSTSETRTVAEVEDALIAAHRDIVTALQSKDIAAVGELNTTAFEAFAAAYPDGRDARRLQQDYVDETLYDLSRPGARVPELTEPLSCESHAQGRLFECFAADGEPPIRILMPDEEPIYFVFKFSVIDGELRIVL